MYKQPKTEYRIKWDLSTSRISFEYVCACVRVRACGCALGVCEKALTGRTMSRDHNFGTIYQRTEFKEANFRASNTSLVLTSIRVNNA